MDYSKMTDGDVDVEVARKLGCNVMRGNNYHCGCIDRKHWYYIGADHVNETPPYSISWQWAGPLLEMMPGGYLSHHPEHKKWCCCYENLNSRSADHTSPTRAICESFLKWKLIEEGGFFK